MALTYDGATNWIRGKHVGTNYAGAMINTPGRRQSKTLLTIDERG